MQRQTSCLASSPEFLWIGFRGCDARAFEGLLNMAGLICCDWNEQLQELAHSVPVLSLERDGTERRSWRVSSVAEHDLEALRGLLGSRRADSGGAPRPVVIPYQMDPSVEAVIKAALPDGPRVLAPDVETVARIQDKRRQRKLFREARNPYPRVDYRACGGVSERRGALFSRPSRGGSTPRRLTGSRRSRSEDGGRIRTCRGPAGRPKQNSLSRDGSRVRRSTWEPSPAGIASAWAGPRSKSSELPDAATPIGPTPTAATTMPRRRTFQLRRSYDSWSTSSMSGRPCAQRAGSERSESMPSSKATTGTY